jgi:Ca-activated chloride channel family protein
MIFRKRLAAGLCALSATLAAGLFPAAAIADETQAESPKVELVLDVSGSMRTADIDGQSRMSAAKQAFNEVLDAVPDDVRLGIRTLGANYPGKSKTEGCKDTEQLYPVGQLDRTEAKTAVATLSPTGWTPIGPALQAAGKDLAGGDATRRIVLITDGEDTCAPLDPCAVARELAASGTSLVIDTLGLASSDKMREQLTCIAEATGGTYTSVSHKDQLADRTKQLIDRAADAPAVTPTAVDGSASCSTAPLIGAGVYSDREKFAEHRWYRLNVADGQELRASVSVGADRAVNNDYGVLLRAVTGDRELVRGSDADSGRTDVISAGLRYSFAEQDDADTPASHIVCLEVSNSFSAPASVKTTPGLPVELTVGLVSAPDDASDVASFGLGRGWILLAVLTVTGLLAGLLWGWLSRIRVAVWRTN